MNGQKLVAWNLRRLRVAKGLSQEALAAEAGIDRTYVGRLERGRENPTIGLLDRLAVSLSVPVSEFLVAPSGGLTKIEPLPGGPARGGKTKKAGLKPKKHGVG